MTLLRRPYFVSDLVDGIERYFEEQSIQHTLRGTSNPVDLLERYFYSLIKMLVPRPRNVHCSVEFHAKLGTLDGRYTIPIEAIRSRFEAGGDLAEFLSKKASDAHFNDGLLSDFGVHHFHLGAKSDPSGQHVQRTDDLLFVFVQPSDVYFLDVRKHPNSGDPSDYGWSDVDLLNIIDSNWPEALDPYIVHGVEGTTLTDEQRRELRRKNTNVVTQVGGKAIAPPGGGLLANRSNLKCKFLAMKLLAQLRQIEQIIENCWDDCMVQLQRAGVEVSDSAELRLVRVADTNLLHSELRRLTGDLSWSGWAIAEVTKGTLIDWSFECQ